MKSDEENLRHAQLDRTTYPEWREQIIAYESEPAPIEPRSYPGYPQWRLERVRARAWPPLDRVLASRRSASALSPQMPSRRDLSRLLQFAHGISAGHARGPTPSAGGLQALELYLVTFETSWLPAGLYHYDRAGHHLSQIAAQASRVTWRHCVPSLETLTGGAFLCVLAGDSERVGAKYSMRGERFLLMEAGHLAQNLCLLATSLELCAVPLGGFFEREISRLLCLPERDLVLGLVVCGKAGRSA